MNNMHCDPNITVGFRPGALTILANFSGVYKSTSQRAEMDQKAGENTCFGSIERGYGRPLITMFGAPAEDVCETTFFIEAIACNKIPRFSIKTRLKGEVTTITIKYNPAISEKAWKSIYGTLLRKIWLAGVASKKTGTNPAALELASAWH